MQNRIARKGRIMMKKLPKYLIISIIIVAVFIGIGYISYITTGEAWLTVRTYGGEMTGNIGIGFMVDSYYPLVRDGLPSYGGNRFYIAPVSVVVFIALFTGIQYLVSVIFRKKGTNASV